MKIVIGIPIIVLCSFSFINRGQAQRGHEIQIQFGVLFNKGVEFHDYYEPGGTRRHNFEFDQKYTSDFYTVSWRYPISSYIEVGAYFSHSVRASLLLLEAESILFDSDNVETRPPSPFFLGRTKFLSKNSEIGIDARVNIVRFNRFKTYFMLSTGLQRISVSDVPGNTLEVKDPGLKQDLLNTYLIEEYFHTISFGLGISRLLSNGINIKILEVYGRNHTEESLMLSFPVSLEIRTGVSYQLYKRK